MRRAPRRARGLALRQASASPQASGVADDAITVSAARRRRGRAHAARHGLGPARERAGFPGARCRPRCSCAWARSCTASCRSVAHRVNRVRDLDSIPSASTMPSVLKVREWYARSCSPRVPAETTGGSRRGGGGPGRARARRGHDSGTRPCCTRWRSGRAELRARIARAAAQRGRELGLEAGEPRGSRTPTRSTRSSTARSRIGIRMLIGRFQYDALREPPEPGHTGLIAHATSPAEVIRAAIADAALMRAPARRRARRADPRAARCQRAYAAHLHYVLLEPSEGGARRRVPHARGRHRRLGRDAADPSSVNADGEENEDIAIKEAQDEGGGKRRTCAHLVAGGDRRPARQRALPRRGGRRTAARARASPPMNRWRPASRAARSPAGRSAADLAPVRSAFGGDPDIKSMEGYGTDA